MKNIRFNIFNQIHKALRHLLYETAIAIQQTDFSSKEEGLKTVARIREVIAHISRHGHTEDTILLPSLAAFSDTLVTQFEAEHKADEELSENLTGLLQDYTQETDTQRLEGTGIALLASFNEYLAFNIAHMSKEEVVINKALWETYTDEEILAIDQKIISQLTEEENRFYAALMMRALSNADIKNWLTGVKHQAPAPVFNGLSALGQQVLADRWPAIASFL